MRSPSVGQPVVAPVAADAAAVGAVDAAAAVAELWAQCRRTAVAEGVAVAAAEEADRRWIRWRSWRRISCDISMERNVGPNVAELVSDRLRPRCGDVNSAINVAIDS